MDSSIIIISCLDNKPGELYKVENLEKDLREGILEIHEPILDKCKPIALNLSRLILQSFSVLRLMKKRKGRIELHDGFYEKLITKFPVTMGKIFIKGC